MILRVSLTLLAFVAATPAHANAVWNYLKQYQFGIDYTSSYDHVSASYEVTGSGTEGCDAVTGEPTRQRCQVDMAGGGSSGYGFVLQQAFKRQGDFYFKPDVGFGVRYLSGEMDDKAAAEQQARGLPLDEMSFALAALVIKPYIQFGITPAKTWPDVLISIGPAAQVAVGNVTVNGQTEDAAIATYSGSPIGGFFELEIVLWRFGDGALSVFSSEDFTGGKEGSNFYPNSKDGMDSFKANFSRNVSGDALGFGLKLVMDWP